jgi:hypothetical protein
MMTRPFSLWKDQVFDYWWKVESLAIASSFDVDG